MSDKDSAAADQKPGVWSSTWIKVGVIGGVALLGGAAWYYWSSKRAPTSHAVVALEVRLNLLAVLLRVVLAISL